MKQCPCCGSGNVKEGKTNGVNWFICHACGYEVDARAKEPSKKMARESKERER